MDSYFSKCQLCPRKCNVNRLNEKKGYCEAGSGYEIASISCHHGEEPVISGKKGICNVFFSHCNLQCMYCQNYQISQKGCKIKTTELPLAEVVVSIKKILNEGAESLGFVSPTHMIPQMLAIIEALKTDGYRPIIVYNTNSYDTIEMLRLLEDHVDVYLPDYKYSDPVLAAKYSDAINYPEIALSAIKEMFRQKGNVLHLNENGIAERGLVVRHLVLPGAVGNSIQVLRNLAEEISNRIAVSLMSQYHPISKVSGFKHLNRKITVGEYKQVVDEMELLGFSKGWIQNPESSDFYLPDFESGSHFQVF